MIGVIDYDAGNLRSVANALESLGLAWTLIDDPGAVSECDRIVLPGVGHFGSAMQRLGRLGMTEAIREFASDARPLLGVCLGAQLLLEASEEAPGVAGLGIIRGSVVKLKTRTIPHMGWNRVHQQQLAVLFDPDQPDQHYYFAHSFVCEPADLDHVAATAECDGKRFCVAVQRERVFGVQFHPEKSAAAGLSLLRRFAEC